MHRLISFDIHRFDKSRYTRVKDVTVEERMASIVVDGQPYLSMMASPHHLDDLALGILFAEGVIDSIDDVEAISVTDNSKIDISLAEKSEIAQQNRTRVRASGFGGGMILEDFLIPGVVIPTDATVTSPQIVDWMDAFNQQSELFTKTGAVHSCCLCIGEQRIFDDDVGRHNALDKVIGRTIRLRLDRKNAVLLTTGRVSTEILLKAAKAGIGIVISRSAPTDRAVEMARSMQMTLCGFARGCRFNVYAGVERIADFAADD